MVVILSLSIVVVIGGTTAALRLSPIRARRRRKRIELVTAAVPERVTPLPVRRPRITDAASRFRQLSAPANVKVLADYRKARASRLRPTRVASGAPRGPRPRRPEPA
jgi:hypothetical protein